MILRRHLFTNVCILFTVCLVILHVSELYNRTDLKVELNILILVFSLISFDFQILLSMRKATRAFWIRALVSSSVPPVLLILLPSYVKQSVYSSGLPPTVTTFLLFVLAFIILVLFILMLMLVCADTKFSRSVFSCICSWLCERWVRSSAKSKSSSWVQRVHWIPFLLFFVVVIIIQSMAPRNINGDIRHPCLNAVFTWKNLVSRPPRVTLHVIPSFASRITDIFCSGVP